MAGLFFYLFGRDDTENYAGWLIAAYVLQALVYAAMSRLQRGDRLGGGRAVLVAISASLAAAFAMFFAGASLGERMWPTTEFINLASVLLGLFFWLVILGGCLTWSVPALRRPHPSGLTRVLCFVTLASAIGAAVPIMVARDGIDNGSLLTILAPLIFAIPLWLVRLAVPAKPPPLAPARARDGAA